MAVELNVADALAARRVDDAERSGAVAHVDAAGRRVVAHVVRVVGEFDALDSFIKRRVENVAGAAFRVGDVELVRFGNKADALRLAQAGDRVDAVARLEVYDLDRVVAERRDEEPLPFEIDGEVIDPAFNVGQRDGLYEAQRRGFLGLDISN